MSSAPAKRDGTASRRPTTSLWDRLSMRHKRLIWVWTFLALPILFYCIIRFYPTLQAFYLSFTNWNLMKPPKFIGFANYVKLYNDPQFWKVFRNTFTYLIIGTPLSLIISFVVAFFLDRVRF